MTVILPEWVLLPIAVLVTIDAGLRLWAARLERELNRFRKIEHDRMVDALANAVRMATKD